MIYPPEDVSSLCQRVAAGARMVLVKNRQTQHTTVLQWRAHHLSWLLIEFLNGLVAAKGQEVGIPAPTHAALVQVVQRVERGEIDASPDNIARI